jgi:hypothetical protein
MSILLHRMKELRKRRTFNYKYAKNSLPACNEIIWVLRRMDCKWTEFLQEFTCPS